MKKLITNAHEHGERTTAPLPYNSRQRNGAPGRDTFHSGSLCQINPKVNTLALRTHRDRWDYNLQQPLTLLLALGDISPCFPAAITPFISNTLESRDLKSSRVKEEEKKLIPCVLKNVKNKHVLLLFFPLVRGGNRLRGKEKKKKLMFELTCDFPADVDEAHSCGFL